MAKVFASEAYQKAARWFSQMAGAEGLLEFGEDGADIGFAGRRIRFPITSRHQAQNALTALTAYEAMGLPLDRADEGAAGVQISKWRGE